MSVGDTPVKQQRSSIRDTRSDRTRLTESRQIEIDKSTFEIRCLTDVSGTVVQTISTNVATEIKSVKQTSTEQEGYIRSVALLQKIAQELATCLPQQCNPKNSVTFLAKPRKPPRFHPDNSLERPDILAIPTRICEEFTQTTPSWHVLSSVGEWKPGVTITSDNVGQTRAYVGSLLQARPDNPSVLGITMCPGGYALSYGSPCGYLVMPQQSYGDLTVLIRYVLSLHAPPASLRFADPVRRITLDINSLKDLPVWNIDDPAYGLVDQPFDVISTGDPFGQMTTVFRKHGDDVVILKDGYRNIRRQREVALFDELGDNPCGWVKLEKPSNSIQFVTLPDLEFDKMPYTRRSRERLMLKSTGEPFDKCKTLSDAVGATYDMLEASRWAIVHRRVLHRDISARNVLVYPVPESYPKGDACFINGIYEKNPKAPSLAVLMDLDHGVKLLGTHQSLEQIHSVSTEEVRELKSITVTASSLYIGLISLNAETQGTPMYIARGPSLGWYNIRYRSFMDLPVIQPPEAALRYELAYPGTSFRTKKGTIGRFNDALESDLNSRKPHTEHVIQRPWHDAESTLFVFFIFLLRCRPVGLPKEKPEQLGHMQDLYSLLRVHTIGAGTDARIDFVGASTLWWNKYLHEGLQHITPYLAKMSRVLEADYELLLPAQGIEQEIVLHEILQRLFFELYYNIKCGTVSDVQFDTETFRPIKKTSGSVVSGVDKPSASRYSNEGKRKLEGVFLNKLM
ncbi:hypothetical protein VKT23_016945 [Stygiomarasmius scandens]|uniref:Fungal-type protein kinase domain-containing protein n=1 Tax=Marasmiellus scandens TaxID=2682957 RepID=A0ABR1ITD2_9AGAR